MGNTLVTKGEIPFRDMESNVVVRFSKAFEARFDTTSSHERPGWANSTLGRQDTEFADHLIAANARFAIIEFKASLDVIGTETDKPLRRKLFSELASRRDLLQRCLDIHMVCWGTIEAHQPAGYSIPIYEEVDKIDRYAVMVGPLIDLNLKVPATRPTGTEGFLDRFLGARTVGGSYTRFKKYLDELGGIAGGVKGDSSTIQGAVFVYLPGDSKTQGRYAHARFRGLEELRTLMQPPDLTKDHRPERSRGGDRDHSLGRSGPSLG
ncbi:hypothetical protein BV349_03814 [Pseudomonas syringae pv. actinidiae]|nr:hypothetical protein BV349_03814 [Pseudomonas syringae pv. actinidiae]OSN74914.1 hypothetical protein BV351_04137 [Pseudomonas syringae pv. actinidiae]